MLAFANRNIHRIHMDDNRVHFMLAIALLLLVSFDTIFAQGNGNGTSNGQGNNGGTEKKPPYDAASTHYMAFLPLPETGQERVFCLSRGSCHYKMLTCPVECPLRKPWDSRKQKGCFIDCSSMCQATCKWRRSNCSGYGALCYKDTL